MIFLFRIVILTKYSFSSFIIRLLGSIFCIFIISISLTSIGFDSDFFGKTIIFKFRSLKADIIQYEKIILYINFLIFSIALLAFISKNKLGFFVISYKFLKNFLVILKKIYLLLFYRKRFYKKESEISKKK